MLYVLGNDLCYLLLAGISLSSIYETGYINLVKAANVNVNEWGYELKSLKWDYRNFKE
jgi:hypothetical protein